MIDRVKPDMQQEMLRRADMLQRAKISTELQEHLFEKCKRDILFWFRNFAYTDKNTRMFNSSDPSILPFIPFPFQEEAITEIRNSIRDGTKPLEERTELTNIFIEKSRQMWLSWLIIAVFVYWFIFHNHKYHVVSQKEDYVDKLWDIKSLFGKARFIINSLPKWMLPKDFDRKEGWKHLKYMTISRPDWTGAITWESANPNAGRSGTYNAALLDEFAFASNATAINKSLASATPTRIFNSTPNGEWNEHYRMRKLTVSTKDPYGKIKLPEIKWLRYHRTDHPLRDQTRYENEIKGMSKEQIAQELDIQYNTAIVGRVYSDFPTESVQIEYDPNLPLYVRMDNSHWWADPHAIILAQIKENSIDLIDAIEVNCSVTDMAEFMATQPKSTLWGLTDNQLRFLDRYKSYHRQKATFIDDPYDTHTTLNQSTIYEEYRKVWIYLNTPLERRKDQQIAKAKSNVYKVRYNDNCLDCASALMNARYPEKPEGSNSTAENTKPIHDWTSHFRTAFEYWITYMLENPLSKKGHKAELSDKPVHNRYLYGN